MNHRAAALAALAGSFGVAAALVLTPIAVGQRTPAEPVTQEPGVIERASFGPVTLGLASVDLAALVAQAQEQEPGSPPLSDEVTEKREEDPDRTVIHDADGEWLATFTDGASTVALAGPSRRFEEASADHGVTSTTWVRLLPEPFDGEVDASWFDAALDDTSADVLEIATEYWAGAPDVVDDDGVLVSADSGYGPLQPDGSRPVGSDWHDFQGVEGIYDGEVDPPDEDEYRSLDCSGYVRMVFGVRSGLPMTLWPDDGASLPRRARHQASDAPGIMPVADRGERVGDEAFERLQPGDLVFFDAPSDDDGRIDHVGIYLGIDDGDRHRFIHSRRSTNGPTMGGDANGPSVLDGDGFFARGFQATRRL